MLDVKKTLAKLLHITEPTTLTRPISGRQTTAWSWTAPYNGILYLSGITYQRHYFGVMWNGANIGDFAVGGNNQGSSAFTLTFILKKGDTISTSALNTNCYLEGARTCFIKLGGVLLSSIFKAFSHLQKIGGGVNAGHKETVSENAELDKSAVHNSLRNGLWKQPELKHSHNSTDSEWLYVCLLGISKLIRMGRVRISGTCRQDNNKAMVPFVQSEWHEQSYARLGAICKDICVTSGRRWAVC